MVNHIYISYLGEIFDLLPCCKEHQDTILYSQNKKQKQTGFKL